MIKKIGFVVLFTTISTEKSFAHDVWVDGYNSSMFKGFIKYEHVFFIPQKIENDRIHLFEPLVIIDKDFKSTMLKNGVENGQYNLDKSLDDGTYILKSSYKPTYSTKNENNKWITGKSKKDISNAQYCKQISRFAKSIINIGDDKNDFVTKPIGQNLEIVPLENPSNFKTGVSFKVKVLLDGKPAQEVALKGTFESFKKEEFAFSGTTDSKGEIEILPLRGGKWILLTKVVKPYEGKDCDEISYSSTLSFQVK